MMSLANSDLPVLSPEATESQIIRRPLQDTEKGFNSQIGQTSTEGKIVSAFSELGWLDRFLALWILLAMAIGIILGNLVTGIGPAIQKGQFVGVSVPIS